MIQSPVENSKDPLAAQGIFHIKVYSASFAGSTPSSS